MHQKKIVKEIWTKISKWIELKTDCKLNISQHTIIFGYPEHRNSVLNLILIAVKYSLFKAKLQRKQPNILSIKMRSMLYIRWIDTMHILHVTIQSL